MLISANLGFLFTENSLPEAIRAAKRSGFGAVEFHFPYETGAGPLRDVLAETGLPALGLNTRPGDRERGEFGLCALPGRVADARAEIDRAIEFAAAAGVRHVHVMAGRCDDFVAAEAVFRDNLRYACDLADQHGVGVLIEPINTYDVPGYHLSSPDHATEIIAALDAPHLRMMFDCYHMGRMDRDVAADLKTFGPVNGHLQIAAVPDRGAPDHGSVDYAALWPVLQATGLTVGAEYKPEGWTKDSLGWLESVGTAGN